MVECAALEMRYTGNRIEGSNPSLSATSWNYTNCYGLLWTAISAGFKGFFSKASTQRSLPERARPAP